MLLLNDTLSPCFVNRYLSSCGILMTRVPPLFRAVSGRTVVAPARASSTSQSPSTRGRSTLKDVLLGMFPTKFDLVHDLLLFFIEVHDYVSPSVPAKIVYVTGHGNIYCVSFLGIWGYWSMDLFWLYHVITSYLGTASDNRCLTF